MANALAGDHCAVLSPNWPATYRLRWDNKGLRWNNGCQGNRKQVKAGPARYATDWRPPEALPQSLLERGARVERGTAHSIGRHCMQYNQLCKYPNVCIVLSGELFSVAGEHNVAG